MHVINFAGSPGAGKSTSAAGLFHYMKVAGCKVELVTEWIKEAVWEDRKNIYADQLYILAKQNRKLARLKGKVDFVISDSPLLLGLAYVKPNYYEHFKPFLLDIWNSYNNYNLFIEPGKKYVEAGRLQTEAEALEKSIEIKRLFREFDCENTVILPDGNMNRILLTVGNKFNLPLNSGYT